MKRYWLSAIVVLLAAAPVGAQGRSGIDWNARAPWGVQRNAPPDQQKKDPVRIFDNVWDVGLQTVTPYLVTTSAGLVLFDSTWAETAGMVLDNVRKAGFDPKNIKYIIMTHAHIDHFGGAGKIKESIPGVRVAMSAPDWDFAEQQLKNGARQGNSVPAPLARDVVIKDGETLKMGGTTFKFYVTPGHTPGSTSVEYRAGDRGKTYRVLSPGGLGMPGPEWTQAYLKSTERLKALGPWDVMLPNHPGMMIPRDLAAIEKELPVKGQGPHPAVAGAAKINDWFDAILKVTREKLAAEQSSLAGQGPAGPAQTYTAPRTADGKPDLQGIWQARNSAYADLQDHPARLIGDKKSARLFYPAGLGVVENNEIPYQPWAAAKQKENFQKQETADPMAQCYMAGVPRTMSLPLPFQIFQTPKYIAIVSEYTHTWRNIYMDGSPHIEGIEFWMGDSRGRWEGETLVVDVRDFNDKTWFDMAGNFHSEDLHVVERYTRTAVDRLQYDVTIDDPKVFTRPWKISMPIYRVNPAERTSILEYECGDLLEEAAGTLVPVKIPQ